MPHHDRMMALNAELWRNNDSERQTKNVALDAKQKKDMALNVEPKTWLWTPN